MALIAGIGGEKGAMRKQNPLVVARKREATIELGHAEGAKFEGITKADVMHRLLKLAKLAPERTRGNIIGQVQALKAIAEIEGYGVNRCDPTKEFANRTVAQADPRIVAALRDPFIWATEYTQTYNPHWVEEGRPSPYEPSPKYLYLEWVFAIMQLERIWWWEKSRHDALMGVRRLSDVRSHEDSGARGSISNPEGRQGRPVG